MFFIFLCDSSSASFPPCPLWAQTMGKALADQCRGLFPPLSPLTLSPIAPVGLPEKTAHVFFFFPWSDTPVFVHSFETQDLMRATYCQGQKNPRLLHQGHKSPEQEVPSPPPPPPSLHFVFPPGIRLLTAAEPLGCSGGNSSGPSLINCCGPCDFSISGRSGNTTEGHLIVHIMWLERKSSHGW